MDIIDSFLGDRNGVTHCTCNFNFVPTDPEDVKVHAHHHDEFSRVTRIKNHVPVRYEVREQLKDTGRELLGRAITDEECTAAAELIVRALFDRSFDRAIRDGFGDQHPSLAEFTRMIAEDGLVSDSRANVVLLRKYAGTRRPAGVHVSSLWEL